MSNAGIPSADVAITLDPARVACGYPSQQDLEGPLDGNFEFDPSHIERPWDEALEALQMERRRVLRASAACTLREVYDVLDGDDDDDTLEAAEVLGQLDVGVGTVVRALNAGNCLTSSACSGHMLIPEGDYPRVSFHADEAHAAVVRGAAAETGCGFGASDMPGVLIVWAATAAAFVELGAALIARREELDALPSHGLTARRRGGST